MSDTNSDQPHSSANEPVTLTAREFGARVGLSYQTILRLIKRRKLKCLPYSRHKRIPVSELSRWERGEF